MRDPQNMSWGEEAQLLNPVMFKQTKSMSTTSDVFESYC